MKNYVVTISRGYGSGGKYIATKLAEELNVQLIDRDLIKMASLDSGISEEIFGKYDERVNKSFLEKHRTNIYAGSILPPEDRAYTSSENLFSYQAKILLSKVKDENFVVLGRAANYILRYFPNVISINIQAPFEDCVEEIMVKNSLSAKEAIREIRRIDKYRAEYYTHHTGLDWLDSSNYDLCLNSSRVGRDKCVEVIKDYILCKTGIDARALDEEGR